ncbi:MAG TPA: hypothetical protein PLP73_00330 [Candidatus Absconditabacterales bacterium]|nr:hypothetical protein [Candidatus Absconditabacterales bacterium]
MSEISTKEYERDCIKLFGPLFSSVPLFFKTKDGEEIEIFDTPTQFFINSKNNTPVYSVLDDETKQVVYKIVKDNGLEELLPENMTLHDITQFRRVFWAHPEINSKIVELGKRHDGKTPVELLNNFLAVMVKLKIYSDEQLVNIREFRIYVSKKSIEFDGDVSGDMKSDLYNFLDFGRFNTDDYIIKKADEVLNKICSAIDAGECPDIRKFRSFADRDTMPNHILSMIERLVLLNYCDKPSQKTVDEIRFAVERMDLDMLKDYLDFNPRGWQRYALVFESRENLAVCSRRAGKSFLVVYIAIRQIFLPGQMILYILPVKEDYSEQPFFYIEQMLENVKKKGAELPGFQFNAKQFRVVNKHFKSKIIFLSGQGSSKGKSFSSNLGIVDEAAMIDDDNLYDQAYNSTTDTKGRMRAISTVNVETPINWFFYKKVNLEGTEDARVHTVDIYNNPFIKQAEKEKKERDFKDKNQAVWLADWMAIFVGGAEGFDVTNFFQIDFVYDVVTFKGCKFNLSRNLDKYERFMLFYDPAKNKDKAGLVLIGKKGNNADVLMTGYIGIKNYLLQREVIVDILEYINKFKLCEFGLDLGKAGEAALDWFENRKIAPYGILSTGGNEFTKKTYRRWNVPANIMETNLHSLMAASVVRGYSWLEHIRNEFETYTLAKQRKGNTGHHNDVLSALMNACFIRYERKLIGFGNRVVEKKVDTSLVDAFGRPIKTNQGSNFNGNFLSKFLH